MTLSFISGESAKRRSNSAFDFALSKNSRLATSGLSVERPVHRVDLVLGGVEVHEDHELDAALPALGGVLDAGAQHERAADEGERDGDGEDRGDA